MNCYLGASRAPGPAANLETERVLLEPDEVQQQPEYWRKLGEEITEQPDWNRAKFLQAPLTVGSSGPNVPVFLRPIAHHRGKPAIFAQCV